MIMGVLHAGLKADENKVVFFISWIQYILGRR